MQHTHKIVQGHKARIFVLQTWHQCLHSDVMYYATLLTVFMPGNRNYHLWLLNILPSIYLSLNGIFRQILKNVRDKILQVWAWGHLRILLVHWHMDPEPGRLLCIWGLPAIVGIFVCDAEFSKKWEDLNLFLSYFFPTHGSHSISIKQPEALTKAISGSTILMTTCACSKA